MVAAMRQPATPNVVFLTITAGALGRAAETALAQGHDVVLDAAMARKIAHQIETLLDAHEATG